MRLADYQSFAQALCDPSRPPPPSLRVPAGMDLNERFAIYRNNVHVSLIEALADRFAVVQAMVGEEFFRAMAREYVRAHKPQSPVLAHYGDSFPDFIDTHAAAASLPFLGDMARVERDWSRAWAAADAPAMNRSSLSRFSAAELATARIRAHPAAHLVQSAWPVAQLWQAHQCATPDLSTIQWQPQDVLITRPDAEVRLQCIDAGAAVAASALLAGQSVAAAAEQAADTDLGAALALFIDSGMIAEVLTA
jgi:hypothetical protein